MTESTKKLKNINIALSLILDIFASLNRTNMENRHSFLFKVQNLRLLFALAILLTVFQCREDDPDPAVNKRPSGFGNELAQKWFGLTFRLVRGTAGFTPPVAARTYGYSSVCLYESLVQGSLDKNSLQGLVDGIPAGSFPTLDRKKEHHWELVANAAMAEFARLNFKTSSLELKAVIDSLENAISNSVDEKDASVRLRSIDFGKRMGKAVYDYAATDGKAEAYLANFPDFTLPNIPGVWKPTAPNQKPMQPYWGEVRPFLNNNISGTQPPSHPVYSTDPNSLFYIAAKEVYSNVINLTPETKTIAEFWSDDPGRTATPGGHSMSIALQVIAQEDLNLMDAAEIMAKVGMSIHDAFISCWKCKYQFNLLRPVTYIQEQIDPNFKTLLSTPPFPEYTSGHSVQTGASLTVLADYFGDFYSFTDRTHESRTDIDGRPRSYDSFSQCASEVALSRLYGGIHYRFGIDAGVDQGKKIGRNIASLKLRK